MHAVLRGQLGFRLSRSTQGWLELSPQRDAFALPRILRDVRRRTSSTCAGAEAEGSESARHLRGTQQEAEKADGGRRCQA